MEAIARIISEAAVRLVVDQRGLGAGIRRAIRDAVTDSTRGGGLFSQVDRDSDRTARRVGSAWTRVFGALRATVGGFVGAVAGIGKILLVGTAAGGALAGVVSLTAGVLALGQALVQASGVAALLPAVFAGLAAVSATLRIGLMGVGDAMKALGKDSAKFEEAIAGLAPEAQNFMRTLRALRPAFDGLRLAVQNRLFQGLSDTVKDLSGKYLPVAQRLFVAMAGSINDAGRNLGTFLGQASTVQQVTGVTDNLRSAFSRLTPALTPAVQALLNIVDVGSTFLPRLSSAITDAAKQFAAFTSEAAKSGALAAFIQQAIDTLKQLGRIAANVFGTLGNIMDAAATSGVGLLENIERITQSIQDWTGSFAGQTALTAFFDSMRRTMDALMPVAQALFEVFARDLTPILADIASIIGPALIPIISAIGDVLQALRPAIVVVARGFAEMGPIIADVARVLGDALADALSDPALIGGIVALAKSFGDVLKALAPSLPLLAKLAGMVLGSLAQVLSRVAPVLGELATTLLDALLPVLPDLIAAFLDLVDALLPIAKDVGLALIDVFVALAPLLPPIVSAFAALWTVLGPLVGALTAVVQAVAGAIGWLGDLADTAIGAINDVIDVVLGVEKTWQKTSDKSIEFSDTVSGSFGRIGQAATASAATIGQAAGAGGLFFGSLAGSAASSFGRIQDTQTQFRKAVESSLIPSFNRMRDAGAKSFWDIANAARSASAAAVTEAQKLGERARAALAKLSFYDQGARLSQSFADGIANQAALTAAQKAAERLAAAVAKYMPSSPAQLGPFSGRGWTPYRGQKLAEGLAQGMASRVSAVAAAASLLANAASTPLTAPLGSGVTLGGTAPVGGSTAAVGATVINQTNVMRQGTDVKQFSDLVLGRGMADYLSGASTLSVARNGVQAGVNDQWIGA